MTNATTALSTIEEAEPTTDIERAKLSDSARRYAEASCAANTRRAYASDWRTFCAWADSFGLAALPADPRTVCEYLAHLADAGRKASTIERALTSISQAHELAQLDSPRLHPMVRKVRQGLRRTIGIAQDGAVPILLPELSAMCRAALEEGTVLGLRDAALLSFGFAAPLRRAELVAVHVEHLRMDGDRGYAVTLGKSKTNQKGEPRVIGVPYGSLRATCPVRNVRAWLSASQIDSGPLFRRVGRERRVGPGLSSGWVAQIVKLAAARAGLSDPDSYSGHSLRVGFVTVAHRAGKSTRAIMDQTGHNSADSMFKYTRSAQIWDDCAAEGLGL